MTALKLPGFAAVILDMDGLVLDTETGYFNAWQQAARSLGFSVSDAFFHSLSGMHYQRVEQKLMDYCGGALPLTAFRERSAHYWRCQAEQEGIDVKPGFDRLYTVLRQAGLPYCLATNSRMANTMECLRYAGIDSVFTHIVCRDHVEAGKPAPDIFLKAAACLQIPISHCLIVEDSYVGMQAAERAGGFSVLIPSVLPVSPETVRLADAMLPNLQDLAELIAAGIGKKRGIDV